TKIQRRYGRRRTDTIHFWKSTAYHNSGVRHRTCTMPTAFGVEPRVTGTSGTFLSVTRLLKPYGSVGMSRSRMENSNASTVSRSSPRSTLQWDDPGMAQCPRRRPPNVLKLREGSSREGGRGERNHYLEGPFHPP